MIVLEATVMSGPSSPGNLSSVTLVGSTNSDHQQQVMEQQEAQQVMMMIK